jgi:hypothetical protein
MLRPLLVACGWVSLLASALAAEPLQVEDRGEPASFRFEGMATFTSEQLAAALNGDVDFLLAAHPRAGFERMVDTLEGRLVHGYQQVGFPHATVQAQWNADAGCVAVRIAEGRRYRAGGVKIVGTQQSDAKKLSAWILAKALPEKPGDKKKNDEDKLQWKAGEPVTFVPWAWKKFETRVKSGLAAQGFHFPRFMVEVIPDAVTDAAVLLVRIADEGPSGVIGQIRVTGSERYTPQQILDHLGLKTPLAFDAELEQRTFEALRSSGRFLWHKVELTPPADKDGHMEMAITLRDNLPGVPPLDGEFSRTEKVMLRLARWLEGAIQRNEDLTLRVKVDLSSDPTQAPRPSELETIFSAGDGVYLRCRMVSKGGDTFHYEVLVAPNEVTLASPDRDACLRSTGTWNTNGHTSGAAANFHLHGLESPGKDGKQVNLLFGCAAKHAPEGGVDPVAVEFKFDPGVALCELHRTEWQIAFDGPVMRLTHGESLVEVEEATGRLVRFEHRDARKGDQIKVSVAPGALMARREELKERLATSVNGWDAEAPLTSIAQFLLDEFAAVRCAALNNDQQAQLRLVKRLVPRICRNGDTWIASGAWRSRNDTFSFPPPRENADTNLLQLASPLLIRVADSCFPRESPPWTVSRETAFLLAGKSPYARREIDTVLASPTMGPLSSLYAAALFHYINADLSRRSAHNGLFRTDVRFFRRDLEWLLSPDSVTRAPLIEAAEALRSLTAEERSGLASLVTSDGAQREAVLAALLPLFQADSAAAALPATLEMLWEAALKQHVERGLQILSQHGQIRNARLDPPAVQIPVGS